MDASVRRKSSGARRRSGRKPNSDSSMDMASIPEERFSPTTRLESVQEDASSISYRDRLVSIFYRAMLDVIVEQWVSLKDQDIVCSCMGGGLAPLEQSHEVLVTNYPDEQSPRKKERKRKSSERARMSSAELRRSYEEKESLKRITRESLRGSLRSTGLLSKESILRSTGTNGPVKTSSLSAEEKVVMPAEYAIVRFKNGNVYEGRLGKYKFHGDGKFTWADKTVYEGEFVHGEATGRGFVQFTDLSCYHGSVCKGWRHGEGVLNIANSTMLYSGQFKAGKKHGQGWLLYAPNDWYDGGWVDDMREGKGTRQFSMATKYKGSWEKGCMHGQGTMLWTNKDVYTGNWKNDVMDGYGEYVWDSFADRTFLYTAENVYRGSWSNGLRKGAGVLHLGSTTNTKIACIFDRNLKHGPGIIIGNSGRVIRRNPLFLDDKPVSAYFSDYTDTPESKGSVAENSTEDTLRSSDLETGKIEIVAHTSVDNIDISNYVKRVVKKYEDLFTNARRPISSPSLTSESVSSDATKLVTLSNVAQRETTRLHCTIITNLVELKNLYRRYATVMNPVYKQLSFEPLVIRLFLWQMFRDLKLPHSLADLDELMMKNPAMHLEEKHDPFETIHFWQFLHVLLELSWTLHSTDREAKVVPDCGVLAWIFTDFLDTAVRDAESNPRRCLFGELKDMFPLKAAYALYLRQGELHSARNFLRLACLKKLERRPRTGEIKKEIEPLKFCAKGRNVVGAGSSLYFLCDEPTFFNDTTYADPQTENHGGLAVFNELGPDAIVNTMTSICPQMVASSLVVDMDYPLTFIEFYEIVLSCGLEIADKIVRHEEKEPDEVNNVKKDLSKNSVGMKSKSSKASGGTRKKKL